MCVYDSNLFEINKQCRGRREKERENTALIYVCIYVTYYFLERIYVCMYFNDYLEHNNAGSARLQIIEFSTRECEGNVITVSFISRAVRHTAARAFKCF